MAFLATVHVLPPNNISQHKTKELDYLGQLCHLLKKAVSENLSIIDKQLNEMDPMLLKDTDSGLCRIGFRKI